MHFLGSFLFFGSIIFWFNSGILNFDFVLKHNDKATSGHDMFQTQLANADECVDFCRFKEETMSIEYFTSGQYVNYCNCNDNSEHTNTGNPPTTSPAVYYEPVCKY